MSDAGRPSVSRRFQIKNQLGLHARAAAQLVQALSGLDADIVVSKDGQGVSGKSILGLMMLAAAQGSEIEVLAEGPDAAAAIEIVGRLIDERFHEES